MINQMKLFAMQILLSQDIDKKIELAYKIYDLSKSDKKDTESSISIYTIPQYPSRPSHYTHKDDELTIFEKSEKENIKRLLESTFINVEIPAMEASCALIILAPEHFDKEFFCDFSSHIYDEARHAEMIRQTLQTHFGGISKQLSYNFKIWDKVSTAKDLIERIFIENIIEEGWAADKTVDLIKSLRKKDLSYVADLFKLINSDEMRHAKIGNKWAMSLLNQDEELYIKNYENLSKKLHPESSVIHYPPIRIASGFKKVFFDKYLK